MALPKLKVMSVTDAAADRIRSIMANADRPIEAIRVGVKNGGCAGMAYTIDYEEKIRPGDVLGALTGEAGFDAAQIGKINVNEFSTYVAVNRSIAVEAVERLAKGRIKGKNVRVRLMD